MGQHHERVFPYRLEVNRFLRLKYYSPGGVFKAAALVCKALKSWNHLDSPAAATLDLNRLIAI
jgi:hypothetical protein